MREYRAIPAPASPRADFVVHSDGESVIVRDLTVIEPEAAWVRTGLVDASGTPLMARQAPHPIGFITPREGC